MSRASASTAPTSAAVGEHRRVDAADDGAQVAERGTGRRAGLGDQLPGLPRGRVAKRLVGQPEAHPDRDQPGLRAVVQVALDAAQLGGGVVDGLGPGLGEHLDPLLELLGVAVGEEAPGRCVARSRIIGAAPYHQSAPVTTSTSSSTVQQREREADGHARRASRPGRARSSGRAPRSRSRRRRARPAGPDGSSAGTGVPRMPRGHRPVPVGDPAAGRDGQQQQRDPDPDHHQHAADHGDSTKSTQRGHGQQQLARRRTPVSRSCQRPGWLSCMASILPIGGRSRSGARSTPGGDLAPLTAASRRDKAGGTARPARSRTRRGAPHVRPPTPSPACRCARPAGAPPTRGARSSPGSPSSLVAVGLAVAIPTQETDRRRLPRSASPAAPTRWSTTPGLDEPDTENVLITAAPAATSTPAAREAAAAAVAAAMARRRRASRRSPSRSGARTGRRCSSPSQLGRGPRTTPPRCRR